MSTGGQKPKWRGGTPAELEFNVSFVGSRAKRCWGSVVDSWHQIIQRYVEALAEDGGSFPWNYQERPQIGFLACAAWNCGGAVLEEWKTKKSKSGRKVGRGRCDLFIRMPNCTTDFHIEAKWELAWLLKEQASVERNLRNCLGKAIQDARRLKYAGRDEKVAVAFVSVGLGEEAGAEAAVVSFHKLRAKDFGADVLAWVSLDEDGMNQRKGQEVGLVLMVKQLKTKTPASGSKSTTSIDIAP